MPMPMVLRIQIAKFKIRQYLLKANLSNLMLAKYSHYMVWSNSELQLLMGCILSACACNRCQAVFPLLLWHGYEDTKGFFNTYGRYQCSR